jgi:hypothetical protein
MTARRDFCALLGLSALGLAGCDSGNGVGAAANSTRLRVLNLIPNAPAGVTLTIGDNTTPFVSNLPFESFIEYTDTDAGLFEFKVSVDGGATTLIDTTLTLLLGLDYTFIVYGPVEAALSYLLIDTTLLIPDGGTFALRVLNLSNTNAAVDIYLTAPGVDLVQTAPVVKGAPYLAPTAFLPVNNAPNLELRITRTGTKNAIFDALNLNFNDKSIAQLIVYGTGSAMLVRSALLNIDANGTGQVYDSLLAAFKFINAAAGSPPLNLFVDGVLTLANVPFAGASDYQVTFAGQHTITLESSATPGASLLTIPVNLAPASDTSITVSGPPGALQSLVTSDNNLPAAAGYARIRFINASPDLAAMDVYVSFVKTFSNVASNSSTPYIELQADALGNSIYQFGFNIAGTGISVLQIPNVTLIGTKTYSVYVVGQAAALQGVVVADD